jgi:signal transduction histidine kinase
MEGLHPSDLIERASASTSALFDQKPSIQLVKDVPDQLLLITADWDRLLQVLLNLISNAVKFTKTGHVFLFIHQSSPIKGLEEAFIAYKVASIT